MPAGASARPEKLLLFPQAIFFGSGYPCPLPGKLRPSRLWRRERNLSSNCAAETPYTFFPTFRQTIYSGRRGVCFLQQHGDLHFGREASAVPRSQLDTREVF